MGRMTKEEIVELLLGDDIRQVEQATRDFVESLGEIDEHKRALAAIATTLARKLDRDPGMATAAIGRELRETLGKLEDSGDRINSLFEYFSSPLPDTAGLDQGST